MSKITNKLIRRKKHRAKLKKAWKKVKQISIGNPRKLKSKRYTKSNQ